MLNFSLDTGCKMADNPHVWRRRPPGTEEGHRGRWPSSAAPTPLLGGAIVTIRQVKTLVAVMAVLPFMPLYVDDWLTSPTRSTMTATARAIYLDLLMYQWKDGYVPNDPEKLARMTNFSVAELSAAWPMVFPHFNLKNGRYRNRKLAVMRKQKLREKTKSIEDGRRGGMVNARRIKNLSKPPLSTASDSDSMSVSFLKRKPEDEERVPVGKFAAAFAPKNGYDPRAGWERLVVACQRKPVAPRIRKPDMACQTFLSRCEDAQTEAKILAGVEAYKLSSEVSRGVVVSLENFLRDGMWEGTFGDATPVENPGHYSEAERLRRL